MALGTTTEKEEKGQQRWKGGALLSAARQSRMLPCPGIMAITPLLPLTTRLPLAAKVVPGASRRSRSTSNSRSFRLEVVCRPERISSPRPEIFSRRQEVARGSTRREGGVRLLWVRTVPLPLPNHMTHQPERGRGWPSAPK